MKNALRILVVTVAIALAFAALPAATNAQGGGGVIIEATFGSGPNVFNPLFCNDTACARITGLLFPGLTAVEPQSAALTPNQPGGLAKEWSFSEDGKVVTFKLRDDLKWSDGTPITSKDLLWAWEIIGNEAAEIPVGFIKQYADKVEAPDDYTLVVTMKVADCTAVANASSLPVVPSHVLKEIDPAKLKDADFNLAPNVTAGPFKFGEYRAAEQTSLLGDPDATDYDTKAEGFIYKVVPDQTVLVEQFLAGETNVIDGAPVNRRADLKAAADAGTAKVYDFPGNSWDYLAMNFADPTNPQPGLDANGNLIDQGKHPLFSDIKVRQAIAYALDVDSIIKGAVFGEGSRMAANMIPTSWAADADLKPLAFDPEKSKALLDEAGWKVGADGIREKDGVKFTFTLYTNQGNTRREAIGTIAKDQLAQVGIQVDFQAIDFNVLVDRLRSQTFDAVILGWRNGFPDDPDQTTLFTSSGDVPISSQNYVSWNNQKVNDLMAQALTVPGCANEDRAKIYYEIQKLFQEELPYVPMFVINGQYAASSKVDGFDPLPNQMYWNVDTWTVTQ